MILDMKCFVTKVEQSAPPTEDQSRDPVVPRVTGGEVVVTAECSESCVKFVATVPDRVAVGDEVHVRIDLGADLGR